jgi:hypothetical protein
VRSQGIIQYEKATTAALKRNNDNTNPNSLVFRLIVIILFYRTGSLGFSVEVSPRQMLKNLKYIISGNRGMILRLEKYMADEKITIIEGPPPVFEPVGDGWALGLNESPILSNIVMTRLRTFNGPALVERCHRAWRNREAIPLEFRSSDGLIQNAPIVAARNVETDDGDMLLLWIKLAEDEAELEIGYDDDGDEDLDPPDMTP